MGAPAAHSPFGYITPGPGPRIIAGAPAQGCAGNRAFSAGASLGWCAGNDSWAWPESAEAMPGNSAGEPTTLVRRQKAFIAGAAKMRCAGNNDHRRTSLVVRRYLLPPTIGFFLVVKDVECAFGVLKARFNILAVPGRSYSRRTLGLIMRACVILHNMIIDDERGTNLENSYETVESNVGPAIHNHAPPSLAARIQMDNEMRDSPMYTQLQQDLIEHVWANA